jgi:hypothetical protein
VWGIARFSDASSRKEVESLGVITRSVDLGDGILGEIPTDFTYLLHIAADFGEEGVARYCAREFGLPMTIARMGWADGDRGGLRSGISATWSTADPWWRDGIPSPTAPSITTTSMGNWKHFSTPHRSRPTLSTDVGMRR